MYPPLRSFPRAIVTPTDAVFLKPVLTPDPALRRPSLPAPKLFAFTAPEPYGRDFRGAAASFARRGVRMAAVPDLYNPVRFEEAAGLRTVPVEDVLGALRTVVAPARFRAGFAARLVAVVLGDPFRIPPRFAARAGLVCAWRGTRARAAGDLVGVGPAALLLRTCPFDALRLGRLAACLEDRPARGLAERAEDRPARGLAERAEDRPARGLVERAEDRGGALRGRPSLADALRVRDRFPGPASRSPAPAHSIAVIATIPTRKPLFLAFMTDSLTFARLSTFVNSSV